MQCCWENYTLNFCGIKSGSTESSAELPDCLHRSRIAFPIPTKDLSPCRSWGSIQSCHTGEFLAFQKLNEAPPPVLQ